MRATCGTPAAHVSLDMQPFTRETVVDRRQPAIRWSAVLAGTAIALGLWGVLQLLGAGLGLAAIDPDDATSARGAVIGTGAWSVLAPMIAMFAGGFVAARLANTYDRRVAGTHGVVVWGLASIGGLITITWLASALEVGAVQPRVVSSNVDNALIEDASSMMLPINNRLRLAGKPTITAEQLVASARAAYDDDGFDRKDFVEQLDKRTALNEKEATEVANHLGPRVEELVGRAHRTTPAEFATLRAMENTGKGMLALSLSILLGIGTAILGAILALRPLGRDERNPHITAPYPIPTPPIE